MICLQVYYLMLSHEHGHCRALRSGVQARESTAYINSLKLYALLTQRGERHAAL